MRRCYSSLRVEIGFIRVDTTKNLELDQIYDVGISGFYFHDQFK